MNNSYINKDEINNKIYDYIAGYINCSTDQLKEEGTHFVKNKKAAKNHVKILSIRDTNIISLSEEKYELGKQLLSGKTRDELYEGNNLKTLCDIEGFENSLAFDAEGNTNTTIVLCAIKDNEIIAIAGAAPTGKLMEVGIDVKKNWLPKQQPSEAAICHSGQIHLKHANQRTISIKNNLPALK